MNAKLMRQYIEFVADRRKRKVEGRKAIVKVEA
jgi:hypothetical protein